MLDCLRTWPGQEGGHQVAESEGPGFSGPDLSGSLVPFLQPLLGHSQTPAATERGPPVCPSFWSEAMSG